MNYHGICIGGPADGERHAACAPKMQVARLLSGHFGVAPPTDEAPIAQSYLYTWKPIAVAEKGEEATEYGFWLAEGITLQQAMNRLITAYEGAPRG